MAGKESFQEIFDALKPVFEDVRRASGGPGG